MLEISHFTTAQIPEKSKDKTQESALEDTAATAFLSLSQVSKEALMLNFHPIEQFECHAPNLTSVSNDLKQSPVKQHHVFHRTSPLIAKTVDKQTEFQAQEQSVELQQESFHSTPSTKVVTTQEDVTLQPAKDLCEKNLSNVEVQMQKATTDKTGSKTEGETSSMQKPQTTVLDKENPKEDQNIPTEKIQEIALQQQQAPVQKPHLTPTLKNMEQVLDDEKSLFSLSNPEHSDNKQRAPLPTVQEVQTTQERSTAELPKQFSVTAKQEDSATLIAQEERVIVRLERSSSALLMPEIDVPQDAALLSEDLPLVAMQRPQSKNNPSLTANKSNDRIIEVSQKTREDFAQLSGDKNTRSGLNQTKQASATSHLAPLIRYSISNGIKRFHTILTNPDLGRVEVRMSIGSSQQSVHLFVENVVAQRRLEAELDALVFSLKEIGLNITSEQITVNLSGENGENPPQNGQAFDQNQKFEAHTAQEAEETVHQSVSTNIYDLIA